MDERASQEHSFKANLELIARKAKEIAADLPEIAKGREKGLMYKEILVRYDIIIRYGFTSEKVALSAVKEAVKLLIPEGKREEIRETYKKDRASRAGKRSQILEKGVWGMTAEERKEASSSGGREASKQGLGIHAHSKEKRVESGQNRARRALGREPWHGGPKDKETGMDEGDYCIYLSQQSDFQHKSGSGKDQPDMTKILAKIEEVFPPQEGGYKTKSRNISAIRNHIYRSRKKEL